MIDQYPPSNGVLTSLIWRKTMSGGETSLSGYDDASQALSYTPGQEQVYLNGILLVRGDDYTATNGTSITGLSALAASDFVQVNCYNNFSVATLPTSGLTGTISNAQLQNSAITINGTATSLGGTYTNTSASTSSAGIVQLTDSTSSTSTTTAATPNSVKSAYDLANGAIQKTLTTTTGDIIYASAANTPARLGIGSSNQVLTVSGGVPTWATPSGGSFSGVMVHRDYSGTPSVPSNTITYLTWQHEIYDTSNYHSTTSNISRLVLPSTGYYLIHAYVTFNYNYGNYTGGQKLLLRKNGAGTVYEREQGKQNYGYGSSGAGALTGLYATWILPATANDYFEIGAYQDTNVTVTAGGGGHGDSVVIAYLGA